MPTSPGDYYRREWKLFFDQPSRAEASRRATAHLDIRRVLDIGCGAGQELTPFLSPGVLGVGIDIQPESSRVAQEEMPVEAARRTAFVRGSGEALPFPAETFEVIICRVSLPYMNNTLALAEAARVLKPGGAFLLKVHHARFYLRQLAAAVRKRNWRSFVHAARVLVTGSLYHLTGRQFRNWPLVPETFQTRWLLRRRLAALKISAELPDSNPATPSFVLVKTQPPKP